MIFRRLRRWWHSRKNPALRNAEAALQKIDMAAYRRDPCGPGGCRLLQATTCRQCARRLYECESVRLPVNVPDAHGKCATCAPFVSQAPDGWTVDEICSHGTPLWQKCPQCGAPQEPHSLEVERS